MPRAQPNCSAAQNLIRPLPERNHLHTMARQRTRMKSQTDRPTADYDGCVAFLDAGLREFHAKTQARGSTIAAS